ncbi:MAG: hypothetical protein JNN00_19360 [Chitinophagaceae bacterium]|nr:hypothetical protein [Chitinophagaceae bacterium]
MNKKAIIIFFKTTDLFKTKELKQIKNTCCLSPRKVIDFEDVTTDFYNVLGCGKLSSVDAMFVDNEYNIHLIEMKGIKDEDFLEKIDAKIVDTGKKVTDSIKTLLGIGVHLGAPKEFIKVMISPKELRIYPYLLTNVSSQVLHQKKWSELEKKRMTPSSRLGKPIQVLNCNNFEDDFKNDTCYF